MCVCKAVGVGGVARACWAHICDGRRRVTCPHAPALPRAFTSSMMGPTMPNTLPKSIFGRRHSLARSSGDSPLNACTFMPTASGALQSMVGAARALRAGECAVGGHWQADAKRRRGQRRTMAGERERAGMRAAAGTGRGGRGARLADVRRGAGAARFNGVVWRSGGAACHW